MCFVSRVKTKEQRNEKRKKEGKERKEKVNI
jgi:hypothetical protein